MPTEIKDSEYRVGLVPSAVGELTRSGHQVLVQQSAGVGAGLSDADYRSVGAEMAASADDIYARAELIVKVKEPLAQERTKLQRGQVLFTYLHLAADPEQAADLLASGVISIAYETVTSAAGTLPLLTPMSEVAGRMAPHVGARCLEKENGGRGVLLGGVPGVPPADVVILGGGVAGTHAALIAAGMGATVSVIDRNTEALRRVSAQLGTRVRTVFSTAEAIATLCRRADLVVASVLIPGAAAPKLISAETVKAMKPGSVIVDIAIDQGGCAQTSRPTTHSSPTLSGRRGALLRHQYAGRGRPHVHFCAQQRDASVRARACGQRSTPRARPGCASAQRAQCARGQAHASGSCAGAQNAIHTARGRLTPVNLRRWIEPNRRGRPSQAWQGELDAQEMRQILELAPLLVIKTHDQRESCGFQSRNIHLAHVDGCSAGALCRFFFLIFHLAQFGCDARADRVPDPA